MLGCELGFADGLSVGEIDGGNDKTVGILDGVTEGWKDGDCVGFDVGVTDGFNVEIVGVAEGVALGIAVGIFVGVLVGFAVGNTKFAGAPSHCCAVPMHVHFCARVASIFKEVHRSMFNGPEQSMEHCPKPHKIVNPPHACSALHSIRTSLADFASMIISLQVFSGPLQFMLMSAALPAVIIADSHALN